MLHLTRAQAAAEPEALEASTSPAIWAIFLAIFLEISSEQAVLLEEATDLCGANVRTSVRISFEEAIFGCEKEIEINFKETCASCHGTGAKAGTSPQTCPKCNGKGKIMYTQQSFFGQVQNVQTCPECGGSGRVIKERCPDCYGTGYKTVRKKFKVSIPAGIDNGQSIRMAGEESPVLMAVSGATCW